MLNHFPQNYCVRKNAYPDRQQDNRTSDQPQAERKLSFRWKFFGQFGTSSKEEEQKNTLDFIAVAHCVHEVRTQSNTITQ